MNKTLLTLLLMLASLPAAAEQNLILLRHAEKQSNSPDPALTSAGQKRAACIANWLAKQAIADNIKVIYSSNYRRTLATAAAIATKLRVPIRLYAPRKLEEIAAQLKQANESAVVVGHSNTTPQLVEILSQSKTSEMADTDYNSFWQLRKNADVYFSKALSQQRLGCDFNNS